LDGEWGVGLDRGVVEVRGEDELGGRHRGLGGDLTHGRRVAGASGDLLAVGNRLTSAEAVWERLVLGYSCWQKEKDMLDEVVGRRQRRNLTGLRHILTVVRKASGDDGGI
jgi:hypothetical protein